MRKTRVALVPLFVAALGGCPDAPGLDGGPGGARQGLFVGVAVNDVTPDEAELADDTFYLGGYGFPFSRNPTGVHDPVYARAMAIESDGSALVLVVLDAPGFSNRARAEVVRAVADETGLPGDRVLVGSTHSHAAPDLQGVWGGVPMTYRSFVIERAADAAIRAFEGRREATLRATSGVAENRNRRGWGFTDDSFTIIEARGADGAPIGAVVSFAAHPVVIGADNTLISRDFVGYTVDAMEADLGAPVLYFNGIQGDVSPACPDGEYADDFAKAEACGEAYAATMLAGMSELVEVDAAPLEVRRVGWEQEVENALFKLAFDFADYDVRVEGPEGEERFFIALGATAFTLGDDVGGLAFPGEPLTRLGLPLKERLPGRFKLFLGLTTDSTGYFIPGDEWQTGRNDDYEESVSLAPSAGDKAAAEVEGLLQ